jgi:hypothetical protein
MSLRDWLHVFKPVRLQDAVFGSIRFQPQAGFWEGRIVFAPADEQVELFLDGTEAGPTPAQHNLFRELEARYPTILSSIETALARASSHVYPSLPDSIIPSGEEQFHLVAIDLVASGAGTLSLSYEGQSSKTYITIPINNWELGEPVVEHC